MQSMTTIASDEGKHSLNNNIIKLTRTIVSEMSQAQRFQKAKAHVMDALRYKHPRFQSQSLEAPLLFRILYQFQSSAPWEWLLFLCGYVFMYLVILDSKQYATKIALESTILFLFWADTAILMYCKTFDNFKKKNKYSAFFRFKFIIIFLMTADLIIFICLPCEKSRPIRPFRILRCFVPLLFDPEMRKSLFSLLSAYKDILVYFIFFASVIVGYSFIGNQALTFDPNFKDPKFPQNVDSYKTNYDDLGRMIFMLYVTATFDSYPDNQTLIIQNFEPNYIYYIVFIFANMFLFSSIPGTLIYLKFRETRSRILLIDEIRQQHSLILGFVTLAENEANLPIEKLIKFLLYLYKYKIRYVEYITDICLRLDDNNNRSIQVNQFMQLSKILLENSAMLPPTFQDLQLWVTFRKFMNKRFHLKVIIKHWLFELTVSIIIILSFINSIFYIENATKLVVIFDQIFVWLFLFELVLRIIAIGPQNFFFDRWNSVDTILVLLGIIFFFLPVNAINVIAKMGRIFRIVSLLRLISHSNFLKSFKFQIGEKLINIYSTLLQIVPIIIRFMPFFLFFFYIYGILGMEFFYNFYDTIGSPLYNQYQQFSNFQSFIHSQYIMVMVLTEAGWSQVAFDHCWRAPYYYAFIMLFFCLIHITVVYMIATLIKGIFWEVFFTVNTIFQERQALNEQQIMKEKSLNEKSLQIQSINVQIQNNIYIEPYTLIRRELIQNKFDQQIFQKLKKIYDKEKPTSIRRMRRSSIASRIIDEWQININQLKLTDDVIHKVQLHAERSNDNQPVDQSRIPIHQIEIIDQQDLQSEISQLLDKLLVNPKIKYNQLVISPKLFIDFLKSKFKSPEDLIADHRFSLHENPLYNQESMYYHVYEIHALLEIQTSKRQQKALIVNSLIEQNIISEDQGEKLVRKKLQEKNFNIDTSGTLRRLFLSGTNEDLIKKFEIEYFSDLYGYSYKYINKMTLEPLLKLEATLTYSLRNIMRYPQIDTTEFFEMMTHIEDKISNKLLQRGSLFKFVYKLDCQGDVWFSVQYKRHQEMKVHFIKSGIWCYYADMKEDEVMYARDIFNWEFPSNASPVACEQYIKRFYHSFEGLAFSLLNQEKFFQGNPSDYVYDLYVEHFQVEKTMRYKTKRLEISKIMVVALSKQEQRSEIGLEKLRYKLSDIKRLKPRHRAGQDFKLDQSDQQTFEKLKQIAVDSQKIVESQGLPFSYIVNLLKEISEILTVSCQNFVYQIEKVLNEEYEQMNQTNEEKVNDQNSPEANANKEQELNKVQI